MLTNAQEAVLDLMEVMVRREAIYEAANSELRALDSDFPMRVQFIDGDLWRPIMNLLDAAAGDIAPSYFMDEVRSMKEGGCIEEPDGTRWPFKAITDVRAYLEHINSIDASKATSP